MESGDLLEYWAKSRYCWSQEKIFFQGARERLLNVTIFSKQFRAAAGAVTLSCRRLARTNLFRAAQASAGMVYECTALSRGEEKWFYPFRALAVTISSGLMLFLKQSNKNKTNKQENKNKKPKQTNRNNSNKKIPSTAFQHDSVFLHSIYPVRYEKM